MLRVKCFLEPWGEFSNRQAKAMSGQPNVSVHGMLARTVHPVQGRFAPATPVAFGNP